MKSNVPVFGYDVMKNTQMYSPKVSTPGNQEHQLSSKYQPPIQANHSAANQCRALIGTSQFQLSTTKLIRYKDCFLVHTHVSIDTLSYLHL